MKYVAVIILLLVVLVALMLMAILLSNQAHLFTTPGPVARLQVYLTQNRVQTAEQHPFPELRSAQFPVSGEILYRATQSALPELGWELVQADEDESAGRYQLQALVTTPMFHFQDEVRIWIEQRCIQGVLHSQLDVASHSRQGRGDLAANAGHVQRLYAQVRRELERLPPDPLQLKGCQ